MTSVPRLQSILASLTDGVVVADAEGRLVLFNPAAERILGIGIVDAPAREWSSVYGFFRPDGVTPYPTDELPLARALRGETVSEAELFVRNAALPQGAWLSINAAPLVDGRGRVDGGVAIFRDVTAHKRELSQLEMLSNAVEQTADCVLVTDAEGRIQYVNPGFEKTTGYSSAEVLGRTPAILKSGEHGAELYARLWRTLKAGEVFRETLVNRRRDGELFLSEQTITPVRDASGAIAHLVSVGKDVTTARRAAQREGVLQMARRVQQKLYPEAPPRLPGLDICGKAFVADVTGGDYYDFLALSPDRLAIAIGDVSGHGLDSALVMAEMRAVLRASARTAVDPGQMLAAVNRELVADTEDNRFATLLVALLDVPTRRIVYASAGQPGGFVLDGSGAVRARVDATSPPVGLFEDTEFPPRDGLLLEPGDTLVLTTDGFAESQAPDGTFFGAERVLEVVRAHRGESSAAIVGALHAAVRTFSGPSLQQDDMTIVVCSVDR